MIIELFTICQLNNCPEVDMDAIREAEIFMEATLPEYANEVTFRVHPVPYYQDKEMFERGDLNYYGEKIRKEYNMPMFDFETFEGNMIGLITTENSEVFGMADIWGGTNAFVFQENDGWNEERNTKIEAQVIVHEAYHLMNLKHTCTWPSDWKNFNRNPGTWLIRSLADWKEFDDCVEEKSDTLMNPYGCFAFYNYDIPFSDCKVDFSHQFTDLEWEFLEKQYAEHGHNHTELAEPGTWEKIKQFVNDLLN